MEQTFSFDDILIQPKASSDLRSRSQADTSVDLSGFKLELPVIAASMSAFDTNSPDSREITWQFSKAISDEGGMHILSRATLMEDRMRALEILGGGGVQIGMAVSLQEYKTYRNQLEKLPGLVSIDIANGAIIKNIDWHGKYPLVVGNFGNPGALLRQDLKGNLIYKFGIGSGSSCSTRLKTGVGAPQGWILSQVSPISSRLNKPIISDGGIKGTADFVKAIALGADAVMMGYLLAGAKETPWEPIKIDGKWYKPYRGMASGPEKQSSSYIEGISGLVPYEEKPIKTIMLELKDGLTSAMSYSNAVTLPDFQASVQFLRTPHIDIETQTRLVQEE